MTTIKLSELSKIVSHILRHEPWLYELELDNEGWVEIESLLVALRKSEAKCKDLTSDDLVKMIEASDKKRHEIADGKVRALYGHSVSEKLTKEPMRPPDLLYHGTYPEAIDLIINDGLLPMNRQYVHLSTTEDIAKEVGKRKNINPIILTVFAKEAFKNGVIFYKGNDLVWLVDKLPNQFIKK